MIARTYGRRSRFASEESARAVTTTATTGGVIPDPRRDEFSFDGDAIDVIDIDDDDESEEDGEEITDTFDFSQSQGRAPVHLSAFSSQDSTSPWSVDLAELDLLLSNSSNSTWRGGKGETKDSAALASRWSAAASAGGTATLMEAQEFGEVMESVDEINFSLDGLRAGQPVRVRRGSLLSLLNICSSATRCRLLRAHGLAKRVVDAILNLTLDDVPCSIAAAAILFVLANDVQHDNFLDSSACISFLLKLLDSAPESVAQKVTSLSSKFVGLSKIQTLNGANKGTDPSSKEIILKVQEILLSCQEMKLESTHNAGVPKPELSSKWIALLTIEKACLAPVSFEDSSQMGRRFDGSFKERLREHGGLDAIFDLVANCHSMLLRRRNEISSASEVNQEETFQSLTFLLKCFKILENATFLSKENQSHLLQMRRKLDDIDSPVSFVGLVISAMELLSALSLGQKYPTIELTSSEFIAKNNCLESKNDTQFGDYIRSRDSRMTCILSNHKRRKLSTSEPDSILIDSDSSTCDEVSTSSSFGKSTHSKLNANGSVTAAKASSSRSSTGWISLKTRNSLPLGKSSKITDNGKADSCTESLDPFAFDECEMGLSKWDLLKGKKEPNRKEDRILSAREVLNGHEPPAGTQDSISSEPSNQENIHSHGNLSQPAVDEGSSFSLYEDCLLASVKVLMNLTNDNPVGCQLVASCGGLDSMASLIAKHFSSFGCCFKEVQTKKNINLKQDTGVSKRQLGDYELDFLVAILGLLVNLVEKDSQNRVRLASARVFIDKSKGNSSAQGVHKDVIPLFCAIFLSNQGAGEAAEVISLDDQESVLQGQKEAEMMIVEAYSALLLAFLSTESLQVRSAIASCLPSKSLKPLVPVLERFLAFHMTLNMISPETHAAIVKVINSCKEP